MRIVPDFQFSKVSYGSDVRVAVGVAVRVKDATTLQKWKSWETRGQGTVLTSTFWAGAGEAPLYQVYVATS